MVKWFRKLAGAQPPENKVGLEAPALALLAEDLGALAKLARDLPNDALRYILDGVGEEVLARLAQTPGAGDALDLTSPLATFERRDDRPRTRFFHEVRCPDPRLYIRLGRVYEAASRAAMAAAKAQFPLATRVPSSCFEMPGLEWLEALLAQAAQIGPGVWLRECRPCPALSAELVESMLSAAGNDPALLARAVFRPPLQNYAALRFQPVFVSLGDVGQCAVRHQSVVAGALHDADFKQRLYALEMMAKCRVPAGAFLEELVELALSPSKQVRDQAGALLAGVKPEARPPIERKLSQGTSQERRFAVELFSAWEGEAGREILERCLAGEKNPKVRSAIEHALALAAAARGPAEAAPAPTPLAPMPSEAPLGEETLRAWQACLATVNAAIAASNAGPANAPRHYPGVKPVPRGAIRPSFQFLQTGEGAADLLNGLRHASWHRELNGFIVQFWQRPELNLVHLVRFLIQAGALCPGLRADRDILTFGPWLERLFPAFRLTHPEAGLRELGAALQTVGVDPCCLGQGLLRGYAENPAPFALPPGHIWPFWAEHLELLEAAFAHRGGDGSDRFFERHGRRNAFHALATFPQPPERLVPVLWQLALGPKSERAPAQRCLAGLPDTSERLVAALAAGDAESRLAAAEWLAAIGDRRATDPLLAALRREKHEAAKSAMMEALESLGAPVEQFLDRETLLREAERGAAQSVPGDLAWFPFEGLPQVRWADDGSPVEPSILKWWLIQGCKLKRPEPGPLLRRYCARLASPERARLGRFVLEAWLAHDTRPISRAEAEKRAWQQAQQYVQWSQSSYWPKNSPKKTLDGFYAEFLPGLLLQPEGSAIASRGILSLAAACAGAEAAPLAGRFLTQWYGRRAAQCRALIQALAWVEHKTATQLLLAVARRFRTRSIQDEAGRQAQALAQRRGWTVAELADRTIPTAGLDDHGVLALDFGPRQFAARLNERLEFTLADPEGKPLKSLPDPRKDDDEAKAAEARKLLSAARKELKSAVALQRDRLYEGMCTQRAWPAEDWDLYLHRHPIVQHHCQRLVWTLARGETQVALFRPLPDGSLTDVQDNPVTLGPEDRVRVAHECQVTLAESLAWREHLKDYRVEALFEQFGRPFLDLGGERKAEEELVDFRGHLLEAFKLRGRASRLGYTRGQTQDGGCFYDYRKRFPTLALEAVLEFTGNGLPEENRTVALLTLGFVRVSDETGMAGPEAKLPLGQVPPVLLSECWNDARQIAAEGPGFDPDWERKTHL